MPPICLHMCIAKEAAEKLRHAVLDQNLGSYLLGSTAPDVRIITAASREETHFFDLENDRGEGGVSLFFKAYPHLANAAKLGEATRAFVAGYLSHLVADEVWILDIYRPFFGRSSPLGNDPAANMMDRALQFEIDRRERLDRARMESFGAELYNSDARLDIGFIDPATLGLWKTFVCGGVSREPTWERFHLFAERILAPEQRVEPEQVQSLLASIPNLLGRAFEAVSPERIERFREQAISGSIIAVGEYLK